MDCDTQMGPKEAISIKINRLIEQRNALQKLIDVLDEQRIRLEKPHYKGEKGI